MNRLFKKILLVTVIVALFANAPVHAWSWTAPFTWLKAKITNVLWPKNAPFTLPKETIEPKQNFFTLKPKTNSKGLLLDSKYEKSSMENTKI